jgi:hypothetical protein
MSCETGWNGHLDDNVLVTRNPLHGNEGATGTDIHGGTEFKHGPAFVVSAMDENWKCDWEPLPPAGLALGFTHE